MFSRTQVDGFITAFDKLCASHYCNRKQRYAIFQTALVEHLLAMLHRNFRHNLGDQFYFDFQVYWRKTPFGSKAFAPELYEVLVRDTSDNGQSSAHTRWMEQPGDCYPGWWPLQRFNSKLLRPLSAQQYKEIRGICELCFETQPYFDRFGLQFPVIRDPDGSDSEEYRLVDKCLALLAPNDECEFDLEQCSALVELVCKEQASYLEKSIREYLQGCRPGLTITVHRGGEYNDEGGFMYPLESIRLDGFTSFSLCNFCSESDGFYRALSSIAEVRSIPDHCVPVLPDAVLSRHLHVDLSKRNVGTLRDLLEQLACIRLYEDVCITVSEGTD